jgi:hypothetical protein
MSCGFEMKSAPSLIEADAGEMREVVMLGGKKMGDDRAHVWAQVASYARFHSAPEKQQARASFLFKEMTGAWPPKNWLVVTAPCVEVTRAVENKIRAKNIAFKKARERMAA